MSNSHFVPYLPTNSPDHSFAGSHILIASESRILRRDLASIIYDHTRDSIDEYHYFKKGNEGDMIDRVETICSKFGHINEVLRVSDDSYRGFIVFDDVEWNNDMIKSDAMCNLFFNGRSSKITFVILTNDITSPNLRPEMRLNLDYYFVGADMEPSKKMHDRFFSAIKYDMFKELLRSDTNKPM